MIVGIQGTQVTDEAVQAQHRKVRRSQRRRASAGDTGAQLRDPHLKVIIRGEAAHRRW